MPDFPSSLLAERPVEGVLLLKLNRPERRNALATPLLQEIASALAEASQDETVRVAVITGNDKVFAAGADIDELAAGGSGDPIETPRFQAWASIRAFPKPLIAAVEGWCLGAGTELMLCADIVIAAENATIGLPETNLGIMPGAGGTVILPRIVGRALAMKMVLTGEPISAVVALSAGLIAQVTEPSETLQGALTLAEKLSSRAPLAMRTAKASIRDADFLDEAEHLVEERRRFIQLLGTSDKAEGISAFKEKRTPVWRGD